MKTRTLLGACLIALFVLIGCKNKPEAVLVEEEPAAEAVFVEEESAVEDSSNDCAQFLDEYEEFVDKYLEILKKQKANPSDMSIMSDYTSMMSEMSDWEEKINDCSADAQYIKRVSAIQLKIANVTSGM